MTSGVRVRRHHESLRPVLERWKQLMMDPSWTSKDAPWWYNERASLGFFAGAVWSSGGWVMEEYAVSRKERSPIDDALHHTGRKGRADVMYETKNGRIKTVAEAKQVWLRISNQGERQRRVTSTLEAADRQVRAYPDGMGKYRHQAIVFVTPFYTKKIAHDPAVALGRIESLIAEVTQLEHASSAWAFPPNRLAMPSHRVLNHFYPGTAVIIRDTAKEG